MKEIEFSRWLFEGRPRQGKNVLPDGLNWLGYFAGSSKSIERIQFLSYVWNPLIKQTLSNPPKHFWVLISILQKLSDNFLGTFDTQYEINNSFIQNIDTNEDGSNEALEDFHIDDDNDEVKYLLHDPYEATKGG